MRSLSLVAAGALLAAPLLGPGAADAAGVKEIVVVIKDHRFDPVEVRVPADTPVMMLVRNQDATPEEVESHDLHFEKIVAGNSEVMLRLRPLRKGEYAFFGEFHQDTAQGRVIAE